MAGNHRRSPQVARRSTSSSRRRRASPRRSPARARCSPRRCTRSPTAATSCCCCVGIKQSQQARRRASTRSATAATMYFYSFIVALLLFSGGGVFSIYEGVHKLQHPEPVGDITIALDHPRALDRARGLVDARQHQGDEPAARRDAVLPLPARDQGLRPRRRVRREQRRGARPGARDDRAGRSRSRPTTAAGTRSARSRSSNTWPVMCVLGSSTYC